MPKKQEHAHKYKRIFLDRKKEVPAWRCMIPECSHYSRKEFFVGKLAVCWRCGKDFHIKEIHFRQVKPTCCTKALNDMRVDLTPTEIAAVKAEAEGGLQVTFRSLDDAKTE